MNWLLALLLNYLLPGVDDLEVDPPIDEDPVDPADPADPEDPTDPDEPADPDEPVDPDDSDDPPAPRETRAQKTIRETRERAQKAERDLVEARAQLEAARRPQQPAQPDQEQVLWQQEEEVLKNPDADTWQKYAITANRAARNAQSQVRAVQQQTMDMADRTAFQALAATKPKLYSAYSERVEERLKEFRAKGGNPPREVVLHLLLGEDMLKGNVTRSAPKPKAPAAQRRSPASDVPASGRGRVSEAEARAKRLENIRI